LLVVVQMTKHFAFICECGIAVVMAKGYQDFEYVDDVLDYADFREHCSDLGIYLDSDGEPKDFGFCRRCELTKN
jgi:hypothetical protein